MDMKTAISLPDPLFAAAERAARELGVSRSELYRRALVRFLQEHGDAAITARLDRVHDQVTTGTADTPDTPDTPDTQDTQDTPGTPDTPGRLDPVLEALQRASLSREEW